MKTKLSRILTLIPIFTSILSIHVYAQDWPQYHGPDRNGISDQKSILREWPEEGPEVLWTVNIGIGYGGPVIKNGKAYLLDRDDKVGDNLRCFNLSNGEELWNFEYDAPGSVMFPGSRSVPVVDDNYVYSCGPYGDLYCIDLKLEIPVWDANVWTDFGGTPGNAHTENEGGGPGGSHEAGSFPIWAISQCPLIYDDMLILASQAPGAGVVAYEKLTGDIKWNTASLGLVGYVSPTIVKIDGEDHLVMITASGRGEGEKGKVIGIEPKTGKILWEYTNWNCHIPVPSAVDAGSNKLLIVGGYELGATMIKIEKNDEGSYSTSEIFTTEEFGDQTKTPILYNGYFYAQYGTNRRRDGLVCMDMDGNIMWKTKRDPDFNKGSMVLANGLILATDGSKSLYLIEPDPTGYKEISKAELLAEAGTNAEGIAARVGGATQNWAPIALADGKLLIRDQSRLMCVKVSE